MGSVQDLERKNNIRKARCFGAGLAFVFFATGFLLLVNKFLLMESFNFEENLPHMDKSFLVHSLSSVCLQMIALGSLMLVSLVIAMLCCGVLREDDTIVLNRFDRIFTEIKIGILGLAFLLLSWGAVISWDWFRSSAWLDHFLIKLGKDKAAIAILRENTLWEEGEDVRYKFEPHWVMLFVVIVFYVVALSVVMEMLLSLVKNIKSGTLWSASLAGFIMTPIYRSFLRRDSTMLKTMIAMMSTVLMTMLWRWMGLLFLILIVAVMPRIYEDYARIRDGIKAVRDGHLDFKIRVRSQGELGRMAQNVNEIADAEKLVVDNELKNSRLKNELISNVSHDLRTPLTSMITYVDLLKVQGLDDENAPTYLSIIDQKTTRLKKLTDDLFEAAKASSGAMPVENEVIDMKQIVRQALAELEEFINSSGVAIIMEDDGSHAFVRADGRLLWRVVENLLTNVSKHAMPGSRAYLTVRESGAYYALELKNMSKEQLNIAPEELTERFKRGDGARETEGSGLGLTIARDLTSLMKGRFRIDIDGDLFKVTIEFQKAREI